MEDVQVTGALNWQHGVVRDAWVYTHATHLQRSVVKVGAQGCPHSCRVRVGGGPQGSTSSITRGTHPFVHRQCADSIRVVRTDSDELQCVCVCVCVCESVMLFFKY